MSLTLSNLFIGTSLLTVVVWILVLVLFFVWVFYLQNKTLPEPIGELIPIQGPYKDENGFPSGQNGVGPTSPVYCKTLLYGLYGYRAIKQAPGKNDPSAKSRINWCPYRLKVSDPDETGPESAPGFIFRVPHQSSKLISPDIKYELVVSYYSEKTEGEMLVDVIPVGQVSSGSGVLLTENLNPSINRLPSQCYA